MVRPRRHRVSRWSWDADVEDAGDASWDQEGNVPRLQLPRGSETVLLVEDEPEVLDAARGILERLGYTVLVAADADQATRVADERGVPPGVLLTDVVLPSRSGLALAEALRSRWPSLPVLYMSAYTSDHVLPDGPGRAFIQKPFSLEALAREIRALLDAAGA